MFDLIGTAILCLIGFAPLIWGIFVLVKRRNKVWATSPDAMPVPANLCLGLWKRLGACCIDTMILFVGAWLLNFVLGSLIADNIIAHSIYLAAVNLLMLGFYILCWKIWGATPGKMIIGLRVVTNDLKPLQWKNAVMRNIISIIWTIFFISSVVVVYNSLPSPIDLSGFAKLLARRVSPFATLYGLMGLADVIVFLVNKRNRSLHDLIGNTIVVYKTE